MVVPLALFQSGGDTPVVLLNGHAIAGFPFVVDHVPHQHKKSQHLVGTATGLIQLSIFHKPTFGGGIPKVMPPGHVIVGILLAVSMEDVLLGMFGILTILIGTIRISGAVVMVGPAKYSMELTSNLAGSIQTAQISRCGAAVVPSN